MKAKTEIVVGQTYGAWHVLRETRPDAYGRKQFIARATCCGSERAVRRSNLVLAPATCVRCKGNGR